jgi:SOS-response transcriptional repressor LexA
MKGMFMDSSIGTPICSVNRYSNSLSEENIGMSIGSRIREARRAAKMTQKALAQKVGMTQGALSELETGESQSSTLLPSMAAVLGVSALWLGTGKGSMLPTGVDSPNAHRPPFDENVFRVPMGTRPIPVISSVQAGALRDMDCPYEPGDGYAVIYTDDMSLSRWTFSLEVDGDSMLPRFQHGDLLIVDPELSPNPGNFVVARNGTNQATFKKYRPRGIDESGNTVFELVPLNEDYPTLRSDTEKLVVLGVVVEHRNKLR